MPRATKPRHHFNVNSKSEVNILSHFAFGEGLITESHFKELSNDTLFKKYKASGYIKPVSSAMGGRIAGVTLYKPTRAFQDAYRNQINSAAKFSVSPSLIHTAIMSTSISLLSYDLKRNSLKDPCHSRIKNGEQVRIELQAYRKTQEYQNFRNQLMHRYSQKCYTVSIQIKAAADRDERLRLEEEYKFNHQYLEYLQTDNRSISGPDMVVKMNRDQIEEYSQKLRDYMKENISPSRYTKHRCYEQAVERLETLARTMNHSQTMDVGIEAVTDSYSRIRLEAKMNWAEMTGSAIVFLR